MISVWAFFIACVAFVISSEWAYHWGKCVGRDEAYREADERSRRDAK